MLNVQDSLTISSSCFLYTAERPSGSVTRSIGMKHPYIKESVLSSLLHVYLVSHHHLHSWRPGERFLLKRLKVRFDCHIVAHFS